MYGNFEGFALLEIVCSLQTSLKLHVLSSMNFAVERWGNSKNGAFSFTFRRVEVVKHFLPMNLSWSWWH